MARGEVDEHWLARSQALGRAQARYLWVLLIACFFYLALRSSAHIPQASSTEQLQVPVLDLKLDPRVVLAAGAAVLSFLVLVVTGSLRAYSTARTNIGAGSGADHQAERFDTYPNAIDLAVYTTPKSWRPLATIAYFAYPTFLTLALAEGAWLAGDVFSGPLRMIAGRPWFLTIAVLFWLPASWQVGAMWIGRVRAVPKLWKAGAA